MSHPAAPGSNTAHGDLLAGPRQRISGIVPIDRFAGGEAVFLLSLGYLDAPIEHDDLLEIGDFLNRHLAASAALTAQRGGDTAFDPAFHRHSPIDWQIDNFTRYVRERKVSAAELNMMLLVAIGARVVLSPACIPHEIAQVDA